MPEPVSKLFAQQWPFAATIVAVAALVVAIPLLLSGIPAPVLIISFCLLQGLWSHLFEMRILAAGFSPKRWRLVLAEMAIVIVCGEVFVVFHSSGHVIEAALFLVI